MLRLNSAKNNIHQRRGSNVCVHSSVRDMVPSSPVVVITGCSTGGIGYALAKEFVSRGCRVVATDRKVDYMGDLPQIPGVIMARALDVMQRDTIESCIQQVVTEAGRVDIMVNNAGVGTVGPLVEADLATAARVFDVNVWGLLSVSQVVGQQMAKQRGGRIINIGSIAGYAPMPYGGIYAASKAAVDSLSNTLRLELKPFGIQVVYVAPGFVRSNLGDNLFDSDYSGSLYQEAKQTMSFIAQGTRSPDAMPTTAFAQMFVDMALSPNPPREFVVGPNSTLAWLCQRWLPKWLTDFYIYKQLGLDALQQRMQSRPDGPDT